MRVISLEEGARRLDLSRRTFDRIIAEGEGPGIVHISARRRGIIETEFEQWMLKRRHAPPADTYRPQVIPADAAE